MRVGVKYDMRLSSTSTYRLEALLCAVLLMAVFVASCGTGAGNRREAKLEQHKRFLNKPYDVQHNDFLIFPIERQFDIYIMATTMFDPPEMSFAMDIANSRRERAVPYLIEQLGRENFPDYGKEQGMMDTIKEKTIFIFRTLARQGYYDVAGDEAAIKAIQDAIDSMETPALRRISQQYLDEIMSRR